MVRFWKICLGQLSQWRKTIINGILNDLHKSTILSNNFDIKTKPVNTQYDENNTCRYYFATTVQTRTINAEALTQSAKILATTTTTINSSITITTTTTATTITTTTTTTITSTTTSIT